MCDKSAFFHLHKWRLSSSNPDSESHNAIQTILRILTDISTDHIPGVIAPNLSPTPRSTASKEKHFVELFPYAAHMIYLILLEQQQHQRHNDVEMGVMKLILDMQTVRWKIACMFFTPYIGIEDCADW